MFIGCSIFISAVKLWLKDTEYETFGHQISSEQASASEAMQGIQNILFTFPTATVPAPQDIYANIGTSNLRKYLGNNCRKSNWNWACS